MTLMSTLRQFLGPTREAGREWLVDLGVQLLSGALILTGGVFLYAAFFRLLCRVWGVEPVLVITGFGLIALASVILFVRNAYRKPIPIAVQVRARDPMPEFVFDLFFNLGRSLPRRRRD